jgi:tRNA(Arg) A34 adenosine deaminase TadA
MVDIVETQQLTSNGNDPTFDQMIQYLRRANEVAKRALQFGHHPFGCVLVAPNNETILMEQGNVDTVNHAESTLIRMACTNFSSEYLWGCTLYTTFEPCVMCAGTLYWANIGRVVFGATEKRLLELTGNNEKNPTLDIPCRYVFEHGQKDVKVWGPFPELEEQLVEPHKGFWK